MATCEFLPYFATASIHALYTRDTRVQRNALIHFEVHKIAQTHMTNEPLNLPFTANVMTQYEREFSISNGEKFETK